MSLFCFETFFERKSFARHFLKEVTIELYLDGYENYSLNCKDYLKNFLDKLQCKPILKTSVNVEQDRINSINPTNVGYVFDNKEEAYEIVFVEDRIYYKEKKYVGFEVFIENGAPKDILYVNKPHIGTDLLRNVIKNMRNKIISMGGEFRYNTPLTDLIINNNKLEGIIVNNNEKINKGR